MTLYELELERSGGVLEYWDGELTSYTSIFGPEDPEALLVATDPDLSCWSFGTTFSLVVSELRVTGLDPDDEDDVTGRIVDDSKLVSTTAGSASSSSLSFSRISDAIGVGVFRRVPSMEKRALVGENESSLQYVSAAEVVVD